MAAPAPEKKDPAEPVELIHPMVVDEEGRTISRTMRATAKLQELMDFYYDMVPIVPGGKGVFLYRGKRVEGDRTPADYRMKIGDQLDFYSEMKPNMFVLLAVRDPAGRALLRTMRRTDRQGRSCVFWGLGQNPNWRPQININIQLVYMSCKVYFDASQKIHMVKTVVYKYIKL